MEIVPILVISVLIAVASFVLGWDAGRSRNRKFEKAIRASYTKLLEDQKEMRTTDAGQAYNKGWNEGYTEGAENSRKGIVEHIARYQ